MNLEQYDARFDENVNLVGGFINAKRIHTALPVGAEVHHIRESAMYAHACLDTGEDWRIDRGINVIRAVLQAQDTDPQSPTSGIWPYFYEEPPAQMNPPDFNWADFLGVQLLSIAINHNDKLPEKLRTQIREAVIRASQSIIRRNVAMNYTNIAVMGTYVTLIAGQLYNMPELADYGRKRLRRFYDFTNQSGGFPEYNSPTYTIVALVEIARLRHHVEDPESRGLADEIYERFWTDIATHYHAPTGQWAGPHSRAYSTFTMPDTIAFLRNSLPDGVLSEPSASVSLVTALNTRHVPTQCPEHLHHHFQGHGLPRNHIQSFTREDGPVVGYTRLAPSYAIASVNHGIMWDQRHNVIGSWVSDEGGKPSVVRVRFLHDGHDFSSGNLASAQADGAVLIGVHLATDGGDRHCNLDLLQDGKVQASDLRLRVHLSSVPDLVDIPSFSAGQSVVMPFGKVNLMVRVEQTAFGSAKPAFEVTREGEDVCLDVVLYGGPDKLIDLTAVESAYVVMALALWDVTEAPPAPDSISVTGNADRLTAEWTPYPQQTLKVRMNNRPVSYRELRQTALGLNK